MQALCLADASAPACGFNYLHAFPHVLHDPMAATQAGTREDQGSAARDAGRGRPQHASRAKALGRREDSRPTQYPSARTSAGRLAPMPPSREFRHKRPRHATRAGVVFLCVSGNIDPRIAVRGIYGHKFRPMSASLDSDHPCARAGNDAMGQF
jgi:hypothetical protein